MKVPASGKIQSLYCFSSTTDMYDTRQKQPTRFRARYAPYSQPKVALLLGKIKPDPFFLISYNPFNNKMLTQHSTILWGSLQSIQRMIYTCCRLQQLQPRTMYRKGIRLCSHHRSKPLLAEQSHFAVRIVQHAKETTMQPISQWGSVI